MTLPLTPVEKIAFIFCKNGGGAGIVFKIKTTISPLGFEIDRVWILCFADLIMTNRMQETA
jgi:hypothetical protein